MLLGEGRAGKTALCNTLLRKPFIETQLTAGSTKLIFDARRATVIIDKTGRWIDHTRLGTKYKAVAMEESLILSVYDFGGQSVFKIFHHLFLTSYGVYIVVFNMVDILDDNKSEQSLSEVIFWMNSIGMHTRDAMTDKIAPVFLVGTHKDVVSDISNHNRISGIIEERLRHDAGRENIVKNNALCFFPVNNLMGQADDVILNLMCRMESVVEVSDYVKAPKPSAWFKACDKLTASTKSFLTLKEASEIARANGVEQSDVPLLLSFLNKMGMVLWLDEEWLRDVVILDVMTFFIEPASLVICNHISNSSDSTKKIEENCKEDRAKEWDDMTTIGLASRQLMESLLLHKVDESNIPVLINLMLWYGLIVRLEKAQHRTFRGPLSPVNGPSDYYLVPTLLPFTVVDSRTFQDSIWNDVENVNSCYFVFSTACTLSNLRCISTSKLRQDCFLPRGLMEIIVGKAMQWCSLSSIANANIFEQLYLNYATFSYGRQRFRLICIPELNCIRLDIEAEHPLPVYTQICEQINECLKEYFGSLQLISALRYGNTSELEPGFTLLNLEAVKEAQLIGVPLREDGCSPINLVEVVGNYGPWL